LIVKLTISGADVEYDDQVRNISGRLPLRDLSVTGDRVTGRQTVVMLAEGVEAHIEDRDLRLDRLALNVDSGEDEIRIAQATIDGEGAHIEVNGTVRGSDSLVLDLHTK